MKSIILVCALCLYLGESYAENTDGVGAFAYNGPSGRYGGTYGLRDGQVVNQQGTFPPNFSPPSFRGVDDFFPDYFYNLENQLQEANPFITSSPFKRFSPFRRSFLNPFSKRTFDSVENQRLAYAAATKAFDLTTNQAAFNPFFAPSRFPFGGNFPGFDAFSGPSVGQPYQIPDMSNYNYGRNSAFAGAALGPDFSHQMAGISPSNPNNPNINKFSNIGAQPNGYYSVSSNSMAASTVDSSGKKTETRRAETTVNNNGRVTKYKVEN